MTACDVVVVSYRSTETIEAALSSITDPLLPGRLIVVDNNPGDGSADRARLAGADVVEESPGNIGFAAGVNHGLRHVEAPFVVLLNPDARLETGSLAALVAALKSCPDAVIAAPVLVTDDGQTVVGAHRFSTPLTRFAAFLPLVRRIRRLAGEYPSPSRFLVGPGPIAVDYVWGAALVARTDFLREIGGLDERFFMYHEDEDLCRQAHRLGRRVLLVTRARVRHTGAVSSAGMRPQAEARLLYATWQLLAKWQGGRSARLFRLLVPIPLQIRRFAACALGDRVRVRDTRATIRLLHLFFSAGRVR